MVCDKVGVWKMCVKDDVWQRCVWKMMCDKVVCVKDDVWQSCVWKMVFDKVVLKDAKVAVEEPEEEETVGYRIRKQEPHTKMWGINKQINK